MRRFSRGRRRSPNRRRSNWNSAFFQVQDVTLVNNGEMVTGWWKWPAGLRNEGGSSLTEQEITPVDETLVRTIVGANVTLNLAGLLQAPRSVTIAFGLICWDASPVSAGDLDGVIASPGTVPDPSREGGAEWIIRLPFTYTRDNFSLGNQAESFIVSRAMRKLPPRTGILAVLGAFDGLGSSLDEINLDATFDGRMLYKSGVLAS